MKIIKYELCNRSNLGTEAAPLWQEYKIPVTLPWNEANEKIAEKEAHNGAYSIEDDGVEETEVLPLQTRVEKLEADAADLNEALNMILEGTTE